MINNGIISFGNNNTNVINNNVYNELEILLKHLNKNNEDYEIIKETVNTKDRSNLLKLLKKISNKTLKLIKELNLGILENLIVSMLMK